MRSKRLLLLAGALAGVTLAGCERQQDSWSTASSARDVEAATVTLLPGHCAGVIVEDGQHALTAAHCVRLFEARVDVELHDGQRLGGTYVHVDPERDVAVIRLDEVAPVRPLAVATRLPAPGAALLFAGRNDRPGAPQSVQLSRLGRCPSLPGVPQALFTTLRGEKGDSGAPVVDMRFRVVGLVHGGASCSIATPTNGLGAVVRGLALRTGADEGEPVSQAAAPAPSRALPR